MTPANTPLTRIVDSLQIRVFARSQLEEAVMWAVGRSADNPRAFREWLRGLSEEQLSEEYSKLVEETESK